MKRILFLLALLATPAFAELPPPGTARSGKITVDPHNLGRPSEYDLARQKVINREDSRKVQKKIDGYRKRIRDLEAENERLRNQTSEAQPVPVGSPRVAQPAYTEVRSPSKKNRVSGLVGYGPQALTDRRKERSAGNEVGIENGPIVGAQYQRLFGETISAGVMISVPTQPDTKKPSYGALLGLDF